MKKLLSAVAALASLGAHGAAHAAGFAVDTQAARATGMAGAVTATIDDPSAAFYNPAGLAQGKGAAVQAGITPIIPSFNFTPNGGSEVGTKTQVVTPFQLYGAYGFTDELTLGVGVFNAYGLDLVWPEDWVGKQLITTSSLRTYNINPELAFRPHERVRVGVGLQIVRGTVNLQRRINFIDSEGGLELAGDGWGAGGNAGVQVEILPKQLYFGAAYRSAVNLPFEGKAHFSGVPAEFATSAKDQSVHTEVTLPDTVSLGLGFKPMDSLLIGLDAVYYAWQRFDELKITFDDPSLSQTQPKNWKYGWNFHLGGEYAVNDAIRARVGVMYDPTPSPADTLSPDLPDASRINIALGAGYKWSGFDFDLGYQLVIIRTAESTYPALPGSYKGTAQVIGLSVGYAFGGPEKAHSEAMPAESKPAEAKPAEAKPAESVAPAQPAPAPADTANQPTPVPPGTPNKTPIETGTQPAPAPEAQPAPAPAPAK